MKIATLIFLISFSLLCSGQKNDSNKFIQRIGPPVEATYVVVMDTLQIIITYNILEKFNKKWIKDIKILKDDEQQAIYGHKNGVMLIYIKQRYFKKVLRHHNNQ